MADNLSVPIRMLVFSSPDCYACPHVEKIVHKLVGTYMSDVCHVSTINVQQDPKIAEKYNVRTLPTVMIEDEIVLQGLVGENDIRDLLWQRVTSSIMDRERNYDTQKETLLFISKNSFDSIMNEVFIRPNIGDYIHVGVLQQMIISLIAIDKLVPHLLYQAGKDVGLYGVGTYLLITLNPDIGTEFRSKERFEEVIKGLVKYFSDNETINIPMKLAESAEIRKLEDNFARIRIFGLASASGAPFVGEPLCHFFAGEMAGLTEALTGRNAVVHETKCIGTGYNFCEFEIKVSDEDITRNIEEYQDEYHVENRSQHFQMILDDISKRLHESFISPKDVFNRGKIGNEVHFSKLQQAIITLKMTDPHCGALLYSAGRELGIFGPGKHILQRYLEDENYSWPLNLEQALQVLNKFFHFGMIQAAKQRADVKFIREDGQLKIRIYECAIASGSINSGTTFCDFMAGYIAGRITILTSKDCIVNETKCHGTGHDFCEFEIAFVE
ncbi:MAG: V4R domain-containing protein [Asgard group archaeon]|nr:V4R domain-containing protein [Asgard group archaeon]